MIIFINDRPIRITNQKKKDQLSHLEDFDVIIDARLNPVKTKEFKGHTCLINLTLDHMEKIIEDLHKKNATDFHSLYIIVDNKKAFKQKIISLYSSRSGRRARSKFGGSFFMDLPSRKMGFAQREIREKRIV